jgi:hypothetical protein
MTTDPLPSLPTSTSYPLSSPSRPLPLRPPSLLGRAMAESASLDDASRGFTKELFTDFELCGSKTAAAFLGYLIGKRAAEAAPAAEPAVYMAMRIALEDYAEGTTSQGEAMSSLLEAVLHHLQEHGFKEGPLTIEQAQALFKDLAAPLNNGDELLDSESIFAD